MPEQNGEKSQEPTQHRRDEARLAGQVAKSYDLVSAGLLLAGAFAILWLAPAIIDFVGGYARRQWSGPGWLAADADLLFSEFRGTMGDLGWAVLPLLGLVLLMAVAVNLGQIGFLFLPDKLAPEFSRIDPLQGFSRLFSLPSVARLFFGLVKVAVVGAVAWYAWRKNESAIMGLAALDAPKIAAFLGQFLIWTTIQIAAALFVLALFDYGFQRWKHEQELRMTPQEVREEMRNLQGDPQVISRRKAVQRQIALSRLGQTVPKADVVVTNPTELAIAIQYDEATMQAPVVIAKGAGLVAQRIRQLAAEHRIPIIEKKPLAQALFKQVSVNRPIPPQLYAAVAEVLAYVYQLKGKSPARPAA